MDSCFYEKIKYFDANENHKYSYYVKSVWSSKLSEYVYCCNMITVGFGDWIKDRFGY